MNIKCDKCNKTFRSRQNLDYHLEHNACKTDRYICKLCGSGFTTRNSMYRHMKHTCKVKKDEEDEKDQIYMKLIKLEEKNKEFENITQKIVSENKKLKKEILELRTTSKTIVNKANNVSINNGTINNNNIHNNLILVGYGKEDMAKISRDELLKGIRTGFHSTLNLIDTIHFNPQYPEFHNIYISSMKNKYAMMYDGNDWTLVMKDDLIDKLYDDKRNYIEENLDDFLDSLSISQRNALHRWMDADDEHDYIQVVKNKIKLLLYNKRKMVQNIESLQVSSIEDLDAGVGADNKIVKVRKNTKYTGRKAPLAGTKRKQFVRARKNKL